MSSCDRDRDRSMLAPVNTTTDKGVIEMSKFTRVLAVAGVSGALAVGGAGIAQASTDHGRQVSPDRAQSTKLDRNSRDRNHNGRDKGKSKDKGKHKHDHSHDHGKNHK
jgi:hypothetical protein